MNIWIKILAIPIVVASLILFAVSTENDIASIISCLIALAILGAGLFFSKNSEIPQ